jgi:ribonuclease T1
MRPYRYNERMRLVHRVDPRRVTIALALATLLAASLPSVAREASASAVSIAKLPPEARITLDRIRAGGPFPYSRDGVVFGNRERLLPPKAYGYYHEYTVPTPEARTRGARRIVCAGAPRAVAECYYSDDHYRSFRKIEP